MGALNDDAYVFYGQLGYTGSLPDREKAWLRDRGFENWYDFLRALGFSGSVPDMKYAWLLGKGYTGSLNDVLKQYFNEEISLILDFVNNVFSLNMEQFSLTSKVTFTRASTKTYWGSDGLLKTAAINEWPLEYDPVTLQPLGRSVWESRTNLLLRSEALATAPWSATGTVSRTNSHAVAPDGTLTASRIQFPGAGFEGVFQDITVSAGTTHTMSFWIKSTGGAGQQIRAWVDGSGATSTPLVITLTTQWVRYTITHTAGDTSTRVQFSTPAVTTPSDFLVWGVQLEAGAFATPYIKTEATTMTRAADVAVMTGTNFSDWYNQSEGCFVVETSHSVRGKSTGQMAMSVSDNTLNNYMYTTLRVDTSDGITRSLSVVSGGVAQAALAQAGVTVFGTHRTAVGYATNNFGGSVDGNAVATDVAGTVPTVDRMIIGGLPTSQTFNFNGYIRSIVYYPKRLSNAELKVESA